MKQWRQQQILELMAQGKTNKAIAHELGISYFTVKNIATSMYGRLGVSGRSEAVALYLTTNERDVSALEIAHGALTDALVVVEEALTRARGTTTE